MSVSKTSNSLLLLVTYATDLSLRAIKCCSVVFGVTLKLHVINISPSFPAINKHRRLLPFCGTMVRWGRIDNIWPVAALTARSVTRYWLRIAVSAYPTCIRRPRYGNSGRNIAMPFVTEKQVWLGYRIVKKNSKISLFVLTECTNVTDRWTDRRTDAA